MHSRRVLRRCMTERFAFDVTVNRADANRSCAAHGTQISAEAGFLVAINSLRLFGNVKLKTYRPLLCFS